MALIKQKFQWIWYHDIEFGVFPDWNGRYGIRHGFSTRHGGVSKGVYESMNLGFSTKDDTEKIRTNFSRFAKAVGVNRDDLVLSDQTHETTIRIVTEKDRGSGIALPKKYEGVDGLITSIPGLPLATFHADCSPLFFVDPVRKVVGMAHAGWRGAFAGMAAKMVQTMKNNFGSNEKNIQAGIGPAIGPCCFLVRKDVLKYAAGLPDHVTKTEKAGKDQWRLSIASIHEHFLITEGLPMENIWHSEVCTCCEENRLFSHRRMGEQRGNHAAIIQLEVSGMQ